VCRDAPDTVRAMFDGLCALLADGRIPAPRVRSFSIEDSNTAFSVMAKARHIGRVVITHPARGVARARHDAAYLVTGGLGALGLHVAEWLAAQGAGQIVLMGRSMPSAEALTRMDALRQRGVEVDLLQGDVSSASALMALATVVRRPLRGFVHAAGVVDDAVLARVDAVRMATALRPKADGALNLLAATADTDLDLAVFFSSGSALLGSPGQAAYAGANAFLDGLAHRMRRDGRVATSINWGAWGGTGMAATVDERTAREWAARGVSALSVEAAMTMLDASLSSHLAQVVALPIVWSRFLAAIPAEQQPALFAELAPVPEAPRDLVVAATVTIDFRESLLALPARDRPSALTDRLRREVSAVLGVRDPDDLELHAGLMEQGMDSLMAVDLSGRLARALGVALPSTFAFDHPTLAALSRHLLGQLLPPEVPAMTATTGGTLVSDSDVHGLSDADLEAQLRRELDQAGF
jgi:NAD(P)-dependent dehydrogenase (short-subunit alcohol dehydrogenase family)/acyl carrier protein